MAMTPPDTFAQHLNLAVDTVRVLTHQESRPIPIELISMLIALLAVLFGPWIQSRIARGQIKAQVEMATNQIKATVLSNNRQQWINTLRDTIAEFSSVILSIGAMQILKTDATKDDKYLLRTERAQYLISRARLLINPTEDDHKELIRLMDAVIDALHKQDKTALSARTEDVIAVGQKILKNEWNRVKALQ